MDAMTLVRERIVSADYTGAKLRNYINHEFRDLFMIRADTITAMRQKRVLVNGQGVLDSYQLVDGDRVRVEVNVAHAIESRLHSLDVELKYSEPGLAILLKAPGVIWPDVEWAAPALLMLADLPDNHGARLEDGRVVPWFAVNEVEKGVRSLVIVAATEELRDSVVRNIANGRASFGIYALCHGNVPQSNIDGFDGDVNIPDAEVFQKWCLYNHLPVDIFNHVSAKVDSVVKSSSSGHISAVRATVSHATSPNLVLRRFMFTLGYPIAGSQNYTRLLPNHKDKGALLAYVSIDMPSLAYSGQQVSVTVDVPPKLLAVCEREERFYDKRQLRAQSEIDELGPISNSPSLGNELSSSASDTSASDVTLTGDRPAAYVTGFKQFCGHKFRVTPDTLIPRPSTETLVDAAVEILRNTGTRAMTRVLDLGTGSGCILLSLLLAMPDARGVGVDISEPALAVARTNSQLHGLEDRSTMLHGSFEGFTTDATVLAEGPFDFITCNPPYISLGKAARMQNTVGHEPSLALVAGDGGYQAYRAIHASLTINHTVLAPGGCIGFEIGKDMERGVRRIFEDWKEVGTFKDSQGFLRVIVFQRT
ncbi:hypothetical protein GGH94_005080 [Coemansia aciculifera]|uniref:Methyltransferase domain-containing protein n=1 Tax=Coemansia aciculifera TaxID=417176 RepID=A0A9W8M1L9_9FUNG|nr:hypothetical protein GGH94_005080 [Coemansia aciculifera]KAJ2871228.1 hypothetical protein GGH93_004983 [Coemansia aciculifera]